MSLCLRTAFPQCSINIRIPRGKLIVYSLRSPIRDRLPVFRQVFGTLSKSLPICFSKVPGYTGFDLSQSAKSDQAMVTYNLVI